MAAYNSSNGCETLPASRIPILATVKTIPTLSATGNNQILCSGQNTIIILSNPNNVSGITYSWGISPSNTTGASPASNTASTSISQTLQSQSGNTTGTVTYSITANANGCTSPVTNVLVNVNPVPALSVINNIPTLCSGQQSTNIALSNPNGVSGTTYSWGINPSNASGASAASNTTAATISQAITSTTGNTSGSVQYTVTASAAFNGLACTSPVSNATVNVNPVPTASANSQSLFTNYATSIAITNPNNVSGTTYSWTASQNNVGGASNGSGSGIAQILAIASNSIGTATYTIVPSANGCSGTSITATATVIPAAVVTASNNRIVMGANVTMDAGTGYSSYDWKNSSNTTVGTTQTFATNLTDTYSITVTKVGVIGQATSSFTLFPQFGGINENYIITNSIQANDITDAGLIANLPVESNSQSIQYFDDLGRPMQTVVTQASPTKKDLVTPIGYDAFSRESRKYLPYAQTNATDGWYKPNALRDPLSTVTDPEMLYRTGAQWQFYQSTPKVANDPRPYSETVFEPSPLNRPDKDFGVGQAWTDANKFVQHGYLTNVHGTGVGQERVIAWQVDGSNSLLRTAVVAGYVETGGFYSTGQLTVKGTKDEQGREVREYTDKEGRTILKKVQAVDNAQLNNDDHWAQTYYVYNDLGNLSVVLPPEAVKALIAQ